VNHATGIQRSGHILSLPDYLAINEVMKMGKRKKKQNPKKRNGDAMLDFCDPFADLVYYSIIMDDLI
jgi:hypothetical protein